jgi:lipopolysaccharide/colanic/teichoic acid biosynthesis glycosyltransferase
VIAIAIRLETPGRAIYRQERRGRDGAVFSIAKFRTMSIDAESRRTEVEHLNAAEWPLFKVKGRDPRVTRVGSFLRAWSLDELPQLWNVIRGEMSLVGPRPFTVWEADRLHALAAWRLDARPGMTGLWQARGRHELPLREMIRLDHDYISNWSFARDLGILLQTVAAVLSRLGAY